MTIETAQSLKGASAQKEPVTVIGLGAMGRALAAAFVRAGHPTTVWNRTAARAAPLVEQGARSVHDLREALAPSPLIVTCLLDLEVSRALLEPVAETLSGRTLVNLSSDTPERARAAAAWAAAHKIAYLGGAIMVPTPLIGQPEALFLYSGSPSAFTHHRQTLARLGGNLHFLGSDPGLAALYDLGLLDIFYSSMASLVHAFALVGADDVSAASFLPLASQFLGLLPSMAATMASAVDERQFASGLDSLRMEKIGIDHVIEASAARAVDTSTLQTLSATFGRAIAAGHADHTFASIIDALRSPSTHSSR